MGIPIRTELDATTSALVKRVAEAQGLSVEQFAADAIREVAEHDAELIEFAKPGIDDLDAGRWITHEQLIEFLRARRADRDAA